MNCIKLVDTREITREEWLTWRKKGIGGSDMEKYFQGMGEVI